MKILILSNKTPYPPSDGGTIAIWQAAEGFATLGNQVLILSMITNKQHFLPGSLKYLPKGIQLKTVSVPAAISIPGLMKNFLGSKLPYTATRFIDSGFQQELEKILQEETFDVVQLEGLYLCSYISIIRKHSKALISLRAHNIEHEIWERTSAGSSILIKKIYFKNLSKRIKKFKLNYLNKYDLLVPITQRDANQYNSFGNNKPTHIAQIGASVESDGNKSKYLAKKLARKAPRLSLFHLGALDWSPNIEGLEWFLNEIWPNIFEWNPNLEFHIAGRNASKGFTVRALTQKGVVYHGSVSNAKRFMKANGIMVVPLLSGSGMRVKIIEGMMHGKAIISTSIGVEGIDICPNKNCIIANDKNEWINSIKKLIMNPINIIQLGIEGQNLIQEKYDKRKIVGSWAQFYKNQLSLVEKSNIE